MSNLRQLSDVTEYLKRIIDKISDKESSQLKVELLTILASLYIHEKKRVDARSALEKADKLLESHPNQILKKQLNTLIGEIEPAKEAPLVERKSKYDYSFIIGKSNKIAALLCYIDKLIKTDIPIHIFGESGTGKELIAKAIHENGPRKAKHMLSINCGAMTETLLESELFGHRRGSFTGAVEDKKGLFESATGGTLFLDEIGDMSPQMQAKLLRVVQNQEIRRVGDEKIIAIDTRIVSASNKNLQEMVKKGEFREDLYFRINVLNVNIPPLRERKEDIPLLVDYFMKKKSNKETITITDEVMELFQQYPWPGNIRELENLISKLIVLSSNGVIDESVLSQDERFKALT